MSRLRRNGPPQPAEGQGPQGTGPADTRRKVDTIEVVTAWVWMACYPASIVIHITVRGDAGSALVMGTLLIGMSAALVNLNLRHADQPRPRSRGLGLLRTWPRARLYLAPVLFAVGLGALVGGLIMVAR